MKTQSDNPVGASRASEEMKLNISAVFTSESAAKAAKSKILALEHRGLITYTDVSLELPCLDSRRTVRVMAAERSGNGRRIR